MRVIEFTGVSGDAARLNEYTVPVLEAVNLDPRRFPKLVPRKGDTKISNDSAWRILALSDGVVWDASEYGAVWNDVALFAHSSYWTAKTTSSSSVISIPSKPSIVSVTPSQEYIGLPPYIQRWAKSIGTDVPNGKFSDGLNNWTQSAGTWSHVTDPNGAKATAGTSGVARIISTPVAHNNKRIHFNFVFYIASDTIQTFDSASPYITVTVEACSSDGSNATSRASYTVPAARIQPGEKFKRLRVPLGEVTFSGTPTHYRFNVATNVRDFVLMEAVAKPIAQYLDIERNVHNDVEYNFYCFSTEENEVWVWFTSAIDLSDYELASFKYTAWNSTQGAATIEVYTEAPSVEEVEGRFANSARYELGGVPRSSVFAIRFGGGPTGSAVFKIRGPRVTSNALLGMGVSGSLREEMVGYIATTVSKFANGLEVESIASEPVVAYLSDWGTARIEVSPTTGTHTRVYRAVGGEFLLVEEKSNPSTGNLVFYDKGLGVGDLWVSHDGILPQGPMVVWNDRMVVASGTRVWVSAHNHPFKYAEEATTEDAGWSIQLPTVVVGLSVRDGRLLIYTKDGVYALAGPVAEAAVLLRVSDVVAISPKGIASGLVATADGIIDDEGFIWLGTPSITAVVRSVDGWHVLADGSAFWIGRGGSWVKWTLSANIRDVAYYNGFWYVATSSGIYRLADASGDVEGAYLKTGRIPLFPPSRVKWLVVYGSCDVTVTTNAGSATASVDANRLEVPLPSGVLPRWFQLTFTVHPTKSVGLAVMKLHEVDESGVAIRAK